MAIHTNPAYLDRIGALGRAQGQHLASCGADCAPPGVGILLSRICSAAGRTPCDSNRRTRLCIEEECFD
jgi:hypothetical protein